MVLVGHRSRLVKLQSVYRSPDEKLNDDSYVDISL